jgi:hypothetical protein
VLCSVPGSSLEQGFSESTSTVSVGAHASTTAAVKKTRTCQLLETILHDFEVSDESGCSENDERSVTGKSERESTAVSLCSQPYKGKGPSTQLRYIIWFNSFVRLVTEYDIFSWFLNTGAAQVENTKNKFS